MACKSCRTQTRTLVRAAVRASAPRAQSRANSFLPTAAPITAAPRRYFSSTDAAKGLLGSKIMEPYRVIGATEQLYKICAKPANYHITDKERKEDAVQRLEDGEEVGHSTEAENIWHKQFKLLPTFSTWSHVTMLHMYLINARIRCFDREACRNWQQQMIDHFFFECEKKMHVDHGLTSSALRQRYLKDIFVQWRGLILAYDEGLIKGDAILASAVWRNLFKGDPEADPRALAAIVAWMRSALVALEDAPDAALEEHAMRILVRPVDSLWKSIERPLSQVEEGATRAPGPSNPAQTL